MCPILNAGRGKPMHTNHKTQYKPIKQTTPEHQKQNQTRTTKTDTERENTNGKRKQPKTAQILRFGHYLKKGIANQTGKISDNAVYLLCIALSLYRLILVSSAIKLMPYGQNKRLSAKHTSRAGRFLWYQSGRNIEPGANVIRPGGLIRHYKQ